MGISISPKEICTATATMLSEDITLNELVWFDYSPTSIGEVFDVLPAGIVDFDVNDAAGFSSEALDQSYRVDLTLAIDMWVPIRESDTNGRQADRDIWRYWWALVNLLRGIRYYGKTVDGGDIVSGNVEGIPFETQETGLVVRYAWLNIAMFINL